MYTSGNSLHMRVALKGVRGEAAVTLGVVTGDGELVVTWVGIEFLRRYG